jgi:AraC-like DNA-binding protein
MEDGFPADQTAWNLEGMIIVEQTIPAHSFARSAARLRKSAIDHWYLSYLRSGRTWTEVDGHVAEARPGCVELGSLGHPFRGRSTEIQSVCIYLPRERFTRVNAKLDARNNSILTGNFADLLTDFIERTAERLRVLTAEDLPRVVQATSDLIVAGLTAGTKSEPARSQLSSLALMERARRYIQTNLNIIDLAPVDICRALGVSRTRLYQLFAASGGVLAYVQKRRLIAAHHALGDPADERRIAGIAESCGFSSAANFTRAFTREFGYSPREARSALAESRLSDVNTRKRSQDQNSFEEWLRMLGT